MDRTACTEPQCLYKGELYHFYITYIISPTLREYQLEPNLILQMKIHRINISTQYEDCITNVHLCLQDLINISNFHLTHIST